ncbi:MAG: hypothetical protein J6Q49_08625 [Kiritimatiellae bacterium]|nr:hypothetical protein [Kiritimatiellia bacterium]
MKNSTVLAAAMAMGLAFHAQAKTYTPVFTQSFDEAETFKENFVSGTVASEIFGTSDSSESAIPDEATHVQEQKSRYGAAEDAKFYYYNRYESSQGFSIIYKFPSSVTALTDYKVEFDYYLSPLAGNDSSHSGLAIKGTQGIVATFDKQSGGGNDQRTDGCILVYGDNNSQTNTFSTGGRGTNPSNSDWAPYWLHVTVYGNETDGLFLSVEQANGTVVLSAVRVGAFQPIEKLFFYGKFTKSYGTGYIKSFSLDNVVACSGTADAFAWTGNEGDNKWATPGNWTVDGEATTKYPEIGDAVSGLDATALAAMDIAVKLETTGDVTRFVNVCAKNVKVWTGAGANTLWTTLENWKYAVGDFTVYETPAVTDTLRFPASLPEGTEVSFNANTDNADRQGFAMVVDGNVSFVAPGSNTRTLFPLSISGAGVMGLGDNVRVQTPTYATTAISCDLAVNGSASLYLRGNKGKMTVSGIVSGTGTLTLEGDSNGDHSYTLTGDFSAFGGKLVVSSILKNSAAGCSFNFNGDDSTVDLSGAVVQIADLMTLTAGGTYTEGTLKVGALEGAGTINNATASAMTLEVGGNGDDASSAVVLAGTGTWTVKKIGSNRQTLTDETVAYNLTLAEGEIALPVGKTLGTVAKTGGKFAFAVPGDTWTDGEAHTLFTCSDGVAAETLTSADVTLDQNALTKTWLPVYDNSSANTLSVTLTEAVFVWAGGTSGRWNDAANWTIDGETASAAPKGGEKVTIDGATVLIDTDTDISGVTLQNDAKLALAFTDSVLSYTIPAGFVKANFVAAGPYDIAENAGVLAATRVATNFTWTGSVSSEWTLPENWSVGGGYTGVVPGTGDTAVFGTSAEVLVSASAYAGETRLDADVTFSGEAKLQCPLWRGYGKLSLAGITLTAPTEGHFIISNNVEVVAKTTNTLTLETAASSGKSDYRYIYLEGNMTGAGYLALDQRSRQGLASGKFSGDNSEFAGSLTVVNCKDVRDITTFEGANSTSSNAVYTVYGRSDMKGSVFISANTTYCLGALNGSVYQQSVNGQSPSGVVLEIGARDEDCMIGGDLNGTATTIRKVGSSNLVCRAASIGNVEIAGGVYEVQKNTQGGSIKFIGNGVFRSTIAKSGSGDDIDYAQKLDGSENYPIVFDDGGLERTWATAIKASNKAGFTKMGSGTLTLGEPPLYTGLTTVKEGTLVVPEGSDITYNPLSAGTLTGVTPTKFAYPAGTTLTGAESSKTFDGTLDVSNVTAIDVSDATLVKGQPYVIASATTVTGFTKDTIELTLPEGTDTAKWTVKIMSIDAKRSLCVAPPTNPFVVIVR